MAPPCGQPIRLEPDGQTGNVSTPARSKQASGLAACKRKQFHLAPSSAYSETSFNRDAIGETPRRNAFFECNRLGNAFSGLGRVHP